MTALADLLDLGDLDLMLAARYVAARPHPALPLTILNYTAACQYDRAWNPVTRQCRGLIVEGDPSLRTSRVVARPWPKFHNYGEHDQGDPALEALDLHLPVEVTDKLDGSLGVLYPSAAGFAVATRGSFTSEQAVRATGVYRDRYHHAAVPMPGVTFLFEIIYPENRVVLDYGPVDDLVLLGAVENATGRVYGPHAAGDALRWPGLTAEVFPHRTLADALAATPRPNAEGLVVRYLHRPVLVKIKQDDYVALHRILTGVNARNVWEIAAVRACAHLIDKPEHWASYVGVDPARAAEVLGLAGDEWLERVPDEFHQWVRRVTDEVTEAANRLVGEAVELLARARRDHVPADRKGRWETVAHHPLSKEIMRLLYAESEGYGRLVVAAWRHVRPRPESPFARGEDVA